MSSDSKKLKDDKKAKLPSVGDTVLVIMDTESNGFAFSRPLKITSVGDKQQLSGYLFAEPHDHFRGVNQFENGDLFVRDVPKGTAGQINTWHWPNPEHPYAGR